MKKNKVLVLDIETSPILAYIWELGEQRVRVDQIHSDWYIMAWSAKWLSEKQIHYYDTRNQKTDKQILQPLWQLLDEADIVITQNGQKFDSRKINARFIQHKMSPPKPYRHIDTYRLLKRVAEFTSHKLSYLTEKLCKIQKKTEHTIYPGLKLWIECLKNNKQAWNEMKKYNIKDILSTEELYNEVKAWSPESFPKVYDMTNSAYACTTCGYTGSMIDGKPRKAQKYWYKQYKCPMCGAWQKGIKL